MDSMELPLEESRHAKLVLRHWQELALKKVRQAIRDGHRCVMLYGPTGFGKTEVSIAFLMAACERGTEAAFLADRISLIDQTSKRFLKYGLSHGVMQSQHELTRPEAKIQVCSVETLRRRPGRHFKLLVIDEAHILSKSVKKLMAQPDVFVVGLSATPSTRGLGKHFSTVVVPVTTRQLIKEGWLVPYTIYSAEATQPDMEGAEVADNNEWVASETERRVLPIVGDVVAEYLRLGEGRKFICFAASIVHAEELHRQFQRSGIITNLYTSEQVDAARTLTIEEFKKPNSYIRGLISVEALTRGFDVADVSCLILARPLRKSVQTHVQMLGRVMRPAEGKTDAIILDHAGNCRRFYNETEDLFDNGPSELDDGSPRAEAKKREVKDREATECPGCGKLHPGGPVCPSCGHQYPPRVSKVDHLPGKLSPLTGLVEGTKEDRQSVYSQILAIAHQTGRQEGWAAHTFRDRFGDWPNDLRKVEAPPTRAVEDWVLSRLIAFRRGKSTTKRKKAA